MGRTTEATERYERVLSSGIEEGDMRQRAQEYLAQVRAESAKPTLPAESLATSIHPKPDGPVPVHKRPWFWAVVGACHSPPYVIPARLTQADRGGSPKVIAPGSPKLITRPPLTS
jgi:hypothetical protein